MSVIQVLAVAAAVVATLGLIQQVRFRCSQPFLASLAVTVLLVPIKQVAVVAVQLQSDLPR
jgi:hypothetical protein